MPSVWSCNEWDPLDVIPLGLRHSKMMGGGPHCVNLAHAPQGNAAEVLRL
jgi:hypothetical protein